MQLCTIHAWKRLFLFPYLADPSLDSLLLKSSMLDPFEPFGVCLDVLRGQRGGDFEPQTRIFLVKGDKACLPDPTQ